MLRLSQRAELPIVFGCWLLLPTSASGAGRRTRATGSARRAPPRTRRSRCCAAGDSFEHRQVARLRLVEPGEQAVDDPHATLGRDRPGRSSRGVAMTSPSPSSAALSSARTTVVPTAMTRRPSARAASTASRGVARHPVLLRVRPLVAFQAGHAGVQRQRLELDATVRQPLEHVRRERPPRRRHLGRARPLGVDGLVHRQRPAPGHVRVRDRSTIAPEVARHVHVHRGNPEPLRVAIRHQQAHQRAVAEARTARPRARRSCAARPPTDRPARASRSAGRSACRRARRAVTAAGSVAESLATTRSPGRSTSGRSRKCRCSTESSSRWLTSRRTPSRRQAARLRRLVRLERRRQIEIEWAS